MAGDITVPGLGDVPKKYALGAVIVAAGLGVIVYIRSRNAAQNAAAAATTATAADTSGTDTSGYYGSEIDPSTGIPYAEENSGLGTSDYGGAGAYGSGYDAAGYPIGSQADIAWSSQQQSGITTNNEWVQEAIGGAVPGDPGTIQAALSAVLGGITVTTAQKNLFMEAVGILGSPPQGYPPIHTSDTSAQPGTPAPGANVSVPQVAGATVNVAQTRLRAAGLRTSAGPGTSGYIVTSTNPAAGAMVPKNTIIAINARK